MNPIIQVEHFSKKYGGFTGRDYFGILGGAERDGKSPREKAD